MQQDIRSVDTSKDAVGAPAYFHDLHAGGALSRPESVADLIYWLVGPWSRTHSGGFWRADDADWLAQVQRDLA